LKNIVADRIGLILDLVSGPKVLDLGCVDHSLDNVNDINWLHGRLCNKFEYVVGVDILENEIASLKSLGYKVLCSDVENLDLGEKFNTIVAGELIEHLSNTGNFLISCRKNLLEGGKLIISSPNPFCLQIFLAGNFLRNKRWGNGEHVMWLDINTAANLAERYGFILKEHYLVHEKINTENFKVYNKIFKYGVLPFSKFLGGLIANVIVYVFELTGRA